MSCRYNGCTGLKSIYSFNTQPISLSYYDNKNLFDESCYKNATLYVPQDSKQRYAHASIWMKFEKIEEFDPTPVISVSIDNNVSETSRYSINGQRLNSPTKGMNIVKYSDGTVKKSSCKVKYNISNV